MNVLNVKGYKIDLLFEFFIDSDFDISPEDIIREIRDQIILKKENENFVVNDMYMSYKVFDAKDNMIEV